MSSSGKGQSLVKSAEQLQSSWDYAKYSGRVDTGKVIVEGVIDFDFEITLLTVRALDESGVIQTSFCAPIGHLQKNGDYRESWQPQQMSATSLNRSQVIAFKVTNEIGGLGLFGVELFVKGDDVWFSEISPRPHDTGMVTLVTQKQNEFDLHARAILGLPVNSRGVEYHGLAEALAIPDTEVRLFGKPEAFVNRRMGVALATGKNIEEARHKAVKAANLIVIKEDVLGE
jgi:phosphoribosylglycinamide formyltransferase 2